MFLHKTSNRLNIQPSKYYSQTYLIDNFNFQIVIVPISSINTAIIMDYCLSKIKFITYLIHFDLYSYIDTHLWIKYKATVICKKVNFTSLDETKSVQTLQVNGFAGFGSLAAAHCYGGIIIQHTLFFGRITKFSFADNHRKVSSSKARWHSLIISRYIVHVV